MKSDFDKNYLHQMIDGKIVSSWKDVPKPSQELQDALDTFEETQNYGHSE